VKLRAVPRRVSIDARLLSLFDAADARAQYIHMCVHACMHEHMGNSRALQQSSSASCTVHAYVRVHTCMYICRTREPCTQGQTHHLRCNVSLFPPGRHFRKGERRLEFDHGRVGLGGLVRAGRALARHRAADLLKVGAHTVTTRRRDGAWHQTESEK
jgi:hypothetical protein